MKKHIYIFLLLICFSIVGCRDKQIADAKMQSAYYNLMQKHPIQESTSDSVITISNFKIIPIFSYKIGARVLSRERYYFDKGAEIAPVDLALGWGKMSNDSLLHRANIKISQGGRYYHWWAPDFNSLSRAEIETQSANVHLIPLTTQIKKQLLNIDQGDYVYIEGDLVNVIAPDGATMNSSITRFDTGAGACEIILVKKVMLN